MNKFLKFIKFIFWILFFLFSSQANADQTREIKFHSGLDKLQTKAAVATHTYLVTHILELYFAKSHFPFGPNCEDNEKDCRQNLHFSLEFMASSLDLNNDGLKDVLISINHTLYCGSGGCTTNIIINKGDNWDIHSSMFGDGKTFIKDEIINGFQVIYYESGWGPDEQGNMSSNLYKCEADKNKIYQCDIPVKK